MLLWCHLGKFKAVINALCDANICGQLRCKRGLVRAQIGSAIDVGNISGVVSGIDIGNVKRARMTATLDQ